MRTKSSIEDLYAATVFKGASVKLRVAEFWGCSQKANMLKLSRNWINVKFQTQKNIVFFSTRTGWHTILMPTKNTGSYFSALCRLLRKVDRPQSQFYSVPQEFRLTAKLDWLEKSGLWKTLNIKGGPNSQKGPQKDLGPLQGIHLSEISLNSRQIECRDEIM